MRKKHYNGQVLALVLVLIILVATVGSAMYIRAMADKNRVIKERIASESDQLSESGINIMRQVDYNVLLSICSSGTYGNLEEGCGDVADLKAGQISDLSKFFDSILGDGDSIIKEWSNAYQNCENIKINVEYATNEDPVTIDKDKTLEIDSSIVNKDCAI